MSQTPLFTKPEALKETSTFYCPGCGHGIITRTVTEVLDELNLREKTIFVAPVGCSVTSYDYVDVDSIEAAHGRAPAVATGIKRANPDIHVISYQGDGDLASIGLAEIVHAANRGENFTVVFVNNTIYGMTGGQMAPTTLPGQKSATSPRGRMPEGGHGFPMKMCEILDNLEMPSLIARCMIDGPAGVRKAKSLIRKAFKCQMEGKGFSFVEILAPCPTYMRMDPPQAVKHIKETVSEYFPTKVFRDRTEEN